MSLRISPRPSTATPSCHWSVTDLMMTTLSKPSISTEKVLLKTFEENGMKRQWPIDEKFDPNIHNALFELPDPSKEPGTIAHVASAGFVLHDRVIRAAGVGIVSKP